ncbi:arylsulfatase B-like [Littorina saxatilis]|uniref:arylsulfatase B-like n=1 Tax=Littorina saxatilis TaxID=31220 RepID=UPI0038B5E7DF
MSPAKGFAQLLLIVSTFSSGRCQTSAHGRRPHIILIVADDLGWSDVGWRDPEMHTPALDRLAMDGVILNQTYMQAECSPSRAAMLTGKYPFRLGLQHNVIIAGKENYLPASETLLPEHLQRLGYATHIVGKWHLGFCDWKYTPTYRGFDTFYGFYNAAEDYYTHRAKKDGYDFRDNEKVDWSANGTYSTHLFATRAQRIVRDHDPDKPLFLYLSFQAVHAPTQVPQEYIDKYCPNVTDSKRQTFCGMVAAMDEAVGNFTQTLKDSGLGDNAIVIFTTDNGGPVSIGSSNAPLAGTKTTLWEGGTRAVSFLYSQNQTLLPKRNTTFNGIMHVTDWFPTMLSMAGNDDLNITSGIDGMDMWADIQQVRRKSPRKEFVYNIDDVDGVAAIRVRKWKLMKKINKKTKNMKTMLYNLEKDPTETENLASSKAKVVQRLEKKLLRYRRGMVPHQSAPPIAKADPINNNNTWSPGFC